MTQVARTGKVGPGRDVAKRWEPPGKPPGGQTRHSWPASPSKGECKEPVHGMRTRDSLLGRQMVASSARQMVIGLFLRRVYPLLLTRARGMEKKFSATACE